MNNQIWYKASPVQNRMYVVNTKDTNSTSYNVTTVYSINGEYDLNSIKEALISVINNNSLMKAVFRDNNGTLEYTISDDTVNVDIIKCSNNYSKSEFKESIIKSFIKPFDMLKDILYRVMIGVYDEKNVYIILDCHHSIFDGNCVKIFSEEFAAYYEKKSPNTKAEYDLFADWQNNNVSSEDYASKCDFWKEKMQEKV